jgi:NAD(P)-dependent dehydrogenase (short-subunit alcohol dehydrogenase family)
MQYQNQLQKGRVVMDLNGKVSVVTGGARGIGLAIATSLANYGADVVIADINEEGASKAAGMLKGKSCGMSVDVSSVPQIEKMIREIMKKYGRLDILVNNAGILHTSGIEEVTEEEWDRIMAVNLKSAFFASQQALKYMKQQNCGRIINISSIAGRNGGFEIGCGYSASKAGIIGMSRNMARKMAPYGITVNVVAPGTVESEMSRQFSEEAMQSLLANIPLKRLGKPENIGETVAFLSSDAAGFITGAVIDVNGGMFMG